MRNAIAAVFALMLMPFVSLALAGSDAKVPQGDDPWLISEFRQTEQTVVVGSDVLRLTPEAAASLHEQLELRAKHRRSRPGEREDRRFSATVDVGKDAAGRPIVTSVLVH